MLLAVLPSSPCPTLEILANRAIFTLPSLKFLPWRASSRNSEANCGWTALPRSPCVKEKGGEGRKEKGQERSQTLSKGGHLEEPEVLKVDSGLTDRWQLGGGREEPGVKEDSAAVRRGDLHSCRCDPGPEGTPNRSQRARRPRWPLSSPWECASSGSSCDTASTRKNKNN